MCFLKMFCDVKYNGEKFTVKVHEKVIFHEQIKLPEIFKLEFNENELNNIEYINW